LATGTINFREVSAYTFLIVLSLGARIWDLGSRALHHDESLHALYAYNLSAGHGYRHDPMMHGPFQMEATAGIFMLFGDSDFTARLIYAVAGTVLVVLPIFLRTRLGRTGAFLVAVMLAVSPSMLYFSRFARNDILMAVWTLGLVITMWRFIDEGKTRYLFWASALLSLAFATKESAFVITTILGGYLLLDIIFRNRSSITNLVEIGNSSPPVALGQLFQGAWRTFSQGMSLTTISRQASFFLLLLTLSLPLGAGLISIFQETPLMSWSNLVLASPVDSPRVGVPVRGGIVVATVTVGILLWASATIGLRWQKNSWWKFAAIFYAIWVLLYTTFFTNLGGIGSGIWQSLGYWIVQQDVARGNQPLYYYLLITPIYEYLPLLFATVGGIYYWKCRGRFGLFLAFWAIATFALYTYITEKMPWLMVNLALPLIMLAGKFLGDVIDQIEWRRLWRGQGMLVIPIFPVFLILLWELSNFSLIEADFSNYLVPSILIVSLITLSVVGRGIFKRVGAKNFWSFSTVPVAICLLALTIRSSGIAAYENGDIPVEMIVYTQSSPDLARVNRQIVQAIHESEMPNSIIIDQSSGFSWPWAWYLRGRQDVGYVDYQSPLTEAPKSKVLILHSKNVPLSEEVMADHYQPGLKIPHRWWFPENYRGLNPIEFLGYLANPDIWRLSMDYFLHRELNSPLGSEDAVVYVSQDTYLEISGFR